MVVVVVPPSRPDPPLLSDPLLPDPLLPLPDPLLPLPPPADATVVVSVEPPPESEPPLPEPPFPLLPSELPPSFPEWSPLPVPPVTVVEPVPEVEPLDPLLDPGPPWLEPEPVLELSWLERPPSVPELPLPSPPPWRSGDSPLPLVAAKSSPSLLPRAEPADVGFSAVDPRPDAVCELVGSTTSTRCEAPDTGRSTTWGRAATAAGVAGWWTAL